MKHKQNIDPKDVWDVLCQLGHHTHYLASKAIAFWDEYDHSNYRSLQIKAGKIKRVYGIYQSDIKQEDVYSVTSKPDTFFDSKEEALTAMDQLIDSGGFQKDEVHVLYLYKEK